MDSISPRQAVLSDVPLGSILGPLLFIIYINGAPSVTDASTTVPLYADDMKCYRIITDYSDEKKCKHLAITKRRNILQTSYNLNGSRITDVMFN